MRNPNSDPRGGEWVGDMSAWLLATAGTNSGQMERLLRNLRQARFTELTPRQQEMLALQVDEGLNTRQIARRLGVNCSTVSRTIRRAKDRLYRCLQYGL